MATETWRPKNDGTVLELLPNTGSDHYALVDEASHDSDTTYVYIDGTAGAYKTDIYSVIGNTEIPAGATDIAITVYALVKGFNGTAAVYHKLAIQTSGTVYYGGIETSNPSSYPGSPTSYTWSVNPATSSAWAVEDINATAIGLGMTGTVKTNSYCTQVYAEVTYTPAGGSESSSKSASPSSSESASPSSSESPSPSTSPSPSPSSSPSSSVSPSSSESASPSSSESPSPSSSPSSSPSPGWVSYSRGDYGTLPINDTDLSTAYTDQEETDVAAVGGDVVGQDALVSYAIHLFKEYVTTANNYRAVCWARSTLAASSGTITLQVYNRNTATWQTLASNNTAAANEAIELIGDLELTANYTDGEQVIAFRVQQYIS